MKLCRLRWAGRATGKHAIVVCPAPILSPREVPWDALTARGIPISAVLAGWGAEFSISQRNEIQESASRAPGASSNNGVDDMQRFKMSPWLLSLALGMGTAVTSNAQDGQFMKADAVFGQPQQPLVQQISGECAPDACCETGCDEFACDATGGCDSCYLWGGDGWDLSDNLFGEDSAYDVGGWVQLGYTNRSTGLFNTNPHRLNLHQSWLYAEKTADGSEGFDWGFRADLMYGTDSEDTQAFGNNAGEWDFMNGWTRGAGYGWAMPQLYLEGAYGDLSIIAGHFYTLLGYEVVTAPDNFFFSHAFTMFNSEAFTHTGILATYAVSENVEAYAGWTLGWDTGFDQFGNGNSFLGGASVIVTDDLSVTYILTAGDLGRNGNGYTHSLVADWSVTEKLNYVFQSDYVRFNDFGTQVDTIGINQYLLYWFNDCVGVGGRAEWWKLDGDSFYAITGGVNYKPMANLIIRPEVRYQWSPAQNNLAMPAFPVDEGAIFGIDAILTF